MWKLPDPPSPFFISVDFTGLRCSARRRGKVKTHTLENPQGLRHPAGLIVLSGGVRARSSRKNRSARFAGRCHEVVGDWRNHQQDRQQADYFARNILFRTGQKKPIYGDIAGGYEYGDAVEKDASLASGGIERKNRVSHFLVFKSSNHTSLPTKSTTNVTQAISVPQKCTVSNCSTRSCRYPCLSSHRRNKNTPARPTKLNRNNSASRTIALKASRFSSQISTRKCCRGPGLGGGGVAIVVCYTKR
jgi:hypothetical protein